MKKILVTAPVPPECIAPFSGEFDLTVPAEALTYDEVKEKIAGYDGCFILGCRADKELIDAGKDLKVIANFGVGYDNIDWKYATEKKIAVVNTPTQVTDATAEHTVALILAGMKSIAWYDREIRKGNWRAEVFSDRNAPYNGSLLGIAGFGRIGKAVARKCRGLGMEVIYYDPVRPSKETEEEIGASYVPFDELLERADVVSLHMPYTPENHHLINEDSFGKMKKSAYLVNCARGPIVSEKALVQALKENRIKGAALDVYEFEPSVGEELLKLDNVTLTPHIASLTWRARTGMAKEALSGLTGVLRGEKPYNVINPDVLA